MLQDLDQLFDQITTPASLNGPLQREYSSESGVHDLDFNTDSVILSYIDIKQGDVAYWDLVRLQSGAWVEVFGNADPATSDDEQWHHCEVFVDDEGSSVRTPKGVPTGKLDDVALMADHKIAEQIESHGFFQCRNWPNAIATHPTLEPFHLIAIQRGWLDINGSHPNHRMELLEDPPPFRKSDTEGARNKEPVPKAKGASSGRARTKKLSNGFTDAENLCRCYLFAHHGYPSDDELSTDAISVGKLAEGAGVCKATVSRFFADKLRGYKRYVRECRSPAGLKCLLELLAGDFSVTMDRKGPPRDPEDLSHHLPEDDD